MGRTGTNNGGGPRWDTMKRAVCPVCGLYRPVGDKQYLNGNQCRNRTKCMERRLKREAKS